MRTSEDVEEAALAGDLTVGGLRLVHAISKAGVRPHGRDSGDASSGVR